MTWDLIKAERLDRIFSQDEKERLNSATMARLKRLQISVRFTYAVMTPDGVVDATEPQHVYVENAVSAVSDEDLARIGRDQLEQLNTVRATIKGDLHLPTFKQLVIPPAPPEPTPGALEAEANAAARRAEITALLTERIRHLKAIELGILAADDAQVADVKAQLDGAMASDPALVLALIH